MTDKIQKIREDVEKRYEYWKEKEFNSHSIESEIRMSECQHLLLMLNSLQEEPVDYDKLNTMLDDALSKETKKSWNERLDKKKPVTSVWHDASEKPEEENKPIAIKLHSCEIWSPYIVEELSQGWDVFRENVDIKEWAYCDKLTNLTHSVTKISDQEESEWLKELQDKLNSLSKEEFGKVLAKYDKYDEVKEPVSEDLEKASKEWLAPQLDKSYTSYGETKMMELTHFDGYAMLDAIEFGAQWQKKRMMKDAIDTTIKQGCIDLGILIKGLDESKFSFGDKVKVIIIKED